MPAARTVRVPDHVLARAVDGELVLLNLDNEQYYGLDETGRVIWEVLIDAPTTESALEVLLEQFDVDAGTLAADLDQLLEELSVRGLLELDPS